MKPTLKLATPALLYLLSPVSAHQQNFGSRFLDLNSKHDAFVARITNEHLSHFTGPYSKALEEKMALKKQNSDLIDHLGCPDKEGASWMCIELFIEEKSLQLQVLTEMLRGQEEMAEGERECGGSGDAGGG